MTAERAAIVGVVVLALLSCTNGDSGAAARNIDSSIAAAESTMLAFRDSVKGVSQEERVRRDRAALAVYAPDSLEACSYQLPAEKVTRHTTDVFSLELPADFRLTRDGDVNRRKHYGYGRYEFTGSDGSIFSIDAANNDATHSGWTGLVSSECDTDIGVNKAHLDVANATVYAEDRVVHAHFDLSPRLAMIVVAHARSRARQAQLLAAIHTIQVRSEWGVAR